MNVEALEPRRLLSDATPVLDVGPAFTPLTPIVEVGGVGYFAAHRTDQDRLLWRTDGTSAGTYPVTTLSMASATALPPELMEAGGRLFISERMYGGGAALLWVSDGTAAGTRLLDTHNAGVDRFDFSDTVEAVGDAVFYVDGRNLMRTDGTDAGTVLVKTINPNSTPLAYPRDLEAVGDTLFFVAGGGSELWKSDGTAAGTIRVTNTFTYSPSANLTAVGDRLVFYAAGPDRTTGNLYVTDGSARGTMAITNLDLKYGVEQINVSRLVDGILYFSLLSADVGHRGTWSTDGTAAGTHKLLPGYGEALGTVGGGHFVGANLTINSSGELFRINPDTRDTSLLADITPAAAGTNFRRIGEADGYLYFAGSDGDTNQELWRTDGRGVAHAAELVPGTLGSGPSEGGTIGGALLFFANTAGGRTALWRVVPRGGSISGQVFYDSSGDGARGASELGSAGWRVFIDKDADGIWDRNEPFVRTDDNGFYAFDGLRPGNYVISVTHIGGWKATTITTSFVRLLPDGTPIRLFGMQPAVPEYGSVSGVVFDDPDRDEHLSPGETGLAGYRVFVDLDFDGRYDAGVEPFAFSGSDGRYEIDQVPPGRYHVVISNAGGDRLLTSPRIQAATLRPDQVAEVNFGERYEPFTGIINGFVFNDPNSNGDREPGEGGIAGFRVYLDRNNDGVRNPGEPTMVTGDDGAFAFGGLGGGTHRVRSVVATGDWQPTTSQLVVVKLPPGGTRTAHFANRFVPTGVVVGWINFDTNGNGVQDADEGWSFDHYGVAPPRVYLDLNRNGFFNANEPVSVPDWYYNEFRFEAVPAGSYQLRVILPDDTWRQTTSREQMTVTMTSGGHVTHRTLAVRMGQIEGTVFDDFNGNRREEGEPGVAGAGVYLDRNWNAARDPGETFVVTGSDGRYRFNDLLPGTYVVRLNGVPEGQRITLPRHGVIDVERGGLGVHNFAVTASAVILGHVFRDTDGNGRRNGSEAGYVNQLVYIDLDQDGIFDAAEPNILSSSVGSFRIGGLAAGTYRLRVIPDQAYARDMGTIQVPAAQDVTLQPLQRSTIYLPLVEERLIPH